MTQDELSTIGKVIWQHLANVGLTGNEGCATSQALKAVEMAAVEITSKADQRIAELQAELRAWEETAEHYCKADTPISPDGVRGYIAELEAQLNKLANRARVFLSEIENGQGCMCAATALDITPHCDFCDKSMTLSNALPAEDPADF